MGQKVHPKGFRLSTRKDWDSKWFSEKSYAKWLHEDIKIRNFIFSYVKKKNLNAGITRVLVERAASKVKVNIFTARPGIIIGKKGAGVDSLKKEIQSLSENEVFVNITEVRNAEVNARLVSENVALQLERRVAFRRAMKKAVTTAQKFGAKGIKIMCAGRLGGAEMARTEWYREGRVPLHTLRANVDYGTTDATTTYGLIGVKVWIYTGDSYL